MKEVGKTWQIGDLLLAVTKDSEDYLKPRIGQLSVLDTLYTEQHNMGTESRYRDLTAYILSGYENGLLPMIEAGDYNTLISDQGDEGEYYIVSCNSTHKQALNKPYQVYKTKLELRKESPPIDEIGWPGTVFFCARGTGTGANYGGVWKTSNFTDPDTATQPTWTKLSVTGDWPANNLIRSFGIDLANPSEYVYAMKGDDSGNASIIRYSATSGTWTEILGIGTLLGPGPDVRIWDFTVNRSTGDLYAYTESGDVTSRNVGVHISTDRGASWVRKAVATGEPFIYHFGNISAYGNTISLGLNYWVGGNPYCVYSTNNGDVFTWQILAGGSSWFIGQYLNYVLGNWTYTDAGTADNLRRYQFGGADTQINALIDWPGVDNWSPDPDDGSHVRMVYSNGYLYTTTDNWASGFTDKGRLDIGTNPGPVNRVVSSIAEIVNEDYFDMILYGSSDPLVGNPHTIYAADGETDITPEGKSGAHPDTGVDSIDYRAGGPCWRGIQPY